MEASGDLASWTAVAAKPGFSVWEDVAAVTEGAPAGERQPVNVVDPATLGAAPRFLRLAISHDPVKTGSLGCD